MSQNIPRSRASAPMKNINNKRIKTQVAKYKKCVPGTTRSLNDNFVFSSDTTSNIAFDNEDDGTLNNIGLKIIYYICQHFSQYQTI